VFALDPVHLPGLFPRRLLDRLHELAAIDADVCVEDFADPRYRACLADAEVLITGWGCPQLDGAAAAAMPRLRAVLHAAGSVRALIGEAFWDRGLIVSSAAQANAIPVAEYTLAAILFAAKDAFGARERYRVRHRYQDPDETADIGSFGRRVGIIGASRVGRRVLELLRPLDFATSVSDPYLDPVRAAGLGARLLDLDELLAASDIVSLHAPALPETRHLIDRRRLALIPDGAVFINTARGALVDERALTDELESGRISAVLDVTQAEPLPADSPLFRLPNVFLTPHIAGSLGNELARLGETAVEELDRYRSGLPLRHQVHREDLARTA
jgi:phosphoglycerate dehydrogenase-like enzyme